MAENQTIFSIANKVEQYLHEHPGLPENVPKAVCAWRVGFYAYISSSRLGEHLNNYLFEGVQAVLNQHDCGLTNAQQVAFIEYLHEQVPEFEVDISDFIEAACRDFDSNVLAYVEALTSNTTNVH